MRHVVLVILLVAGACSTAARTSAQSVTAPEHATFVPPIDASPADVYRLYDAHRSALGAELQKADAALQTLRAAGREDEYQHAWAAVVDTVDADALNVFLSEAQISELAAMSESDRRMILLMNVEPATRPSRIEVRNESLSGEQATLEVRGYFETPMSGEPGWRSGKVKLVREASGWKVVQEDWDAQDSAAAGPPHGQAARRTPVQTRRHSHGGRSPEAAERDEHVLRDSVRSGAVDGNLGIQV